MAVAQFRVFAEEAVGERVGFRPAMRFDAIGAARHGEHEVAMQFRRGMRRNHDPVLLGQLRRRAAPR